MVALSQRIASAFVVLCGRWGAVSRRARECNVSRQRIYREANDVGKQLDESPWRQERYALQEEVQRLRQENERQRQQLCQTVVLDADKQAEFAVTGQAQGSELVRAADVIGSVAARPSPKRGSRGPEDQGCRRQSGTTFD